MNKRPFKSSYKKFYDMEPKQCYGELATLFQKLEEYESINRNELNELRQYQLDVTIFKTKVRILQLEARVGLRKYFNDPESYLVIKKELEEELKEKLSLPAMHSNGNPSK